MHSVRFSYRSPRTRSPTYYLVRKGGGVLTPPISFASPILQIIDKLILL